jgi:iron-sulfur cluster repair protein YtfE (RIC family)
MRQLTHNYQIKKEWTSAAKLGVNELYEFDYHLQNWLQLEQAILFPKLQKLSLSADN